MRKPNWTFVGLGLVLVLLGARPSADAEDAAGRKPAGVGLLESERIPGTGVWVDPALTEALQGGGRVRAEIWFEDQFLGDGAAYERRAKTFAGRKRRELAPLVVNTLKTLSATTWKRVEKEIAALIESGGIRNVDHHWIVNGFSCGVTADGLTALKKIRDVRKVFNARWAPAGPAPQRGDAPGAQTVSHPRFDPARYQHPWYIRSLLVDRVWREFGVAGRGTLNVVHDFNFVFSPNVNRTLYRNAKEVPFNGEDDDGNGLVDDYHGYNFDHDTGALTVAPVGPAGTSGQKMHGFECAAIICGAGAEGAPYEFGLAPEGRWAGVATRRRLERAVEWAIEQGADTYSMSFSTPGQGEYRSHRRKVMEQGAFCGLYFVSGAGNFADLEIPVQMRQPEDIPNAVFAAAGVQRDLSRTGFSSRGPVEWRTEHYDEGRVDKPAVCAFNASLPFLRRDGTFQAGGLNGNSFAGPMFCGAIALMLSADPELLPWELREIITSTAMDVAAPGYDHETGHGLINCYRAVKEVLRRRAKREGRPTRPYEGRVPGDELDVKVLRAELGEKAFTVMRVLPKGQAAALGVEVGDVVLSYGGTAVRSRAEMRAAKQAADEAGLQEIVLVLRRADKTLELTFAAGPLGINAAPRFQAPVMR